MMIRVSIVEDHKDFRLGLEKLLEIAHDFSHLDSFVNAEDALKGITGEEDLLLLDINLPEMSGTEALPILKSKFPELKIIMLTLLDDEDVVLQSIINGADGYLLKKSTPDEILNAMKICLQGGSPLTPGIATKVLQLFKSYIPHKNDKYAISRREKEILQLLVDGLDNQSIANQLFISIQTVRNHIRHIYEKLQVHSKSQAVVKALREHLL